MIEIRLLRYFLAVVDEGSVTRASAVVRVAQPSISRQLRQLEQSLGVDLFDRSAGRLRLTASGRALLPMARDLVSRAEAAENIVRGLAQNQVMSVSLVAPETTVADVLAPFLATRGPGHVEVNVREALPNEIFEIVEAGDADVGISSGPATADLEMRPLVQFPVWAYAAAGHPLAGQRAVRLERLVEEPLVLLGEQHGTRRVFDDAVALQGLTYRRPAETNVPQVAQAFAAAGRGIAVVTDDRRYDLHPMTIETERGPLTITLFAAWDRTHYAALMLEQLVEELALFVEGRYGTWSQPWAQRIGTTP